MIQTSSHVEVLEFTLNDQYYGLNVAKVLQLMVYNHDEVVEVPNSGEAIIGTTYFRGTPISVVDLKALLDCGVNEEAGSPLLLIAQFSNSVIAFKIDSVSRIHRLEWSQYESLAEGVFDAKETNILGTIKMEDKVLLVLDAEGLVDKLHGHRGFNEALEAVEAGDAKDVRIIYAEDSEIVRQMAVNAMKKAGYSKIVEFATAVDALHYLEENPSEKVDFILSDIEMPGLDGLSFCQQIKDKSELAGIPFVFFSSLINETMKEKCMKLGATDALSKPEVNKLIPLLEKHCQG